MKEVRAHFDDLIEFETSFKITTIEQMEKWRQYLQFEIESIPCEFKAPMLFRLDEQMKQMDDWFNETLISLRNVLHRFRVNNYYLIRDKFPGMLRMANTINPNSTKAVHTIQSQVNRHHVQAQSSAQSQSKERNLKKKSPSEKLSVIVISSDSEESDDADLKTVQKQQAFDNRSKIAIYLGLKCLKLDCKKMFTTQKKLNDHMLKRHPDIRSIPCLLKDCGKSFNYIRNRQAHIKKYHRNVNKWHCAKCAKHYADHWSLSCHYKKDHLNRYHCAFPNCEFTSRSRSSEHYFQKHIVCSYSGCGLVFDSFTSLDKHERGHQSGRGTVMAPHPFEL